MAAGDVVIFRQFLLDLGKKKHDLTSDTFKLAFIKSAANGGTDLSSGASTADPRWGGAGATNLSSFQVAMNVGYSGPITMTSVSWSLVAGATNVPTFRADIITVPQDGAGASTFRWGIIYNDTSAGKEAVAYVDLGGSISNVSAAIIVDWNGVSNDIFTLT